MSTPQQQQQQQQQQQPPPSLKPAPQNVAQLQLQQQQQQAGGTGTSTRTASPAGQGLRYPSNRKTIYDRNINRTKNAELSRAAFAYLFVEMIAYAQKRVSGIADLEKRYVIITIPTLPRKKERKKERKADANSRRRDTFCYHHPPTNPSWG